MAVSNAGPAGGQEGGLVRVSAESMAELYETHFGAAFRLAYLLTGDASTAEDLVQDAFVKLIGRFAHLRDPDAFGPYLKRTVVNLSHSAFRRRRVERAFLAREVARPMTAAEYTPDVEQRDLLWNQLQRLAPRQRAVLVLRYYEDLSEVQAAEVLGCSVQTVSSLAARGLRAMRDQQGSGL